MRVSFIYRIDAGHFAKVVEGSEILKFAERWQDMSIEVALLISIISVAFSVYFGLKNSKKSDKEEIAERIARDTKTDMKLDEISSDVKEVKETVKNIQNDVKDHEGRIVKLEASYKAEHKRIDEVFRMAGFREGDVNE